MSRILIIYYSATARTRRVAEFIQEVTGGDLVSLRPVVPYTEEELSLWKEGHREVTEESLPELHDFPVDVDRYDVIFLGTPVWWYSIAAPMKSFLTTHNLAGKTIYPFVTGDNAAGNALHDLLGLLDHCFVKTGLQVRFVDDEQVTPRRQIENWAKEAVKSF